MRSLLLAIPLLIASACYGATITSGTIAMVANGGTLDLFGPEVEIHGAFIEFPTPWWSFGPHLPGEGIFLAPQISTALGSINGVPFTGALFGLTDDPGTFIYDGQPTTTFPFHMSGIVVTDPNVPGGITEVAGMGSLVFSFEYYDPSIGYPPGAAEIVSATLTFAAVPEPATWMLFVLALPGIFVLRRATTAKALVRPRLSRS